MDIKNQLKQVPERTIKLKDKITYTDEKRNLLRSSYSTIISSVAIAVFEYGVIDTLNKDTLLSNWGLYDSIIEKIHRSWQINPNILDTKGRKMDLFVI